MEAPDLDDARKRYHFALAPEDYERLPFYTALLHELERDTIALELLASVRLEQRNPMLILAALQLAGLRGHSVLGPIYDTARHGQLVQTGARRLRQEKGRVGESHSYGRCSRFQPRTRGYGHGGQAAY